MRKELEEIKKKEFEELKWLVKEKERR